MARKRPREERDAANGSISNGDAEERDGEISTPVDPSTAYDTLIASLKSTQGNRRKEEKKEQEQKKVAQIKISRIDAETDVQTKQTEDESDDELIRYEPPTEEPLDDEDTQEDIVDDFKRHLEHTLTTEEITSLDGAKAKFKVETPALGIQKAKWITNSHKLPNAESKLSNYSIKLRLRKHWQNAVRGKFGDFRSEEQCQLFALCNSYSDVLHSRKASLAGKKRASWIMDAYLFHTINHILKTKDLITKNNDKLHNRESNASVFEVPRDQGFTRPKVLFLLPIRSMALRLVKRLLDLLPPSQKATVDYKQRFMDDFGIENDDPDEKNTSKPQDHQELFGGNNDDHFRIGIKFAKKSIHLYSDFLSSDVVLASPLGLMTSIEEAEADKEKNVDFLSSIEIVVIDFADVILMQNWSHIVTVFEHLNKLPSQQHDVDIMRIREWYLNGHARYFRQTIFLSSYPDAAINAMFLRTCVNHSGKIKLCCRYDGVLSNVIVQVRQVYEGLQCDSISEVDDARFEFFKKQIFPRMKESLQGGILLFVRSYFDFVRLRNFLKAESASFCLLGEYTKTSDISRARTWFYHGQRRIMLYTERAHFYHRYKIRGVRELIFYSLPDHSNFYSEIVNMLEGGQNPSCTAIYSKFDNLQLERIVGSSRTQKLLTAKETMMFF